MIDIESLKQNPRTQYLAQQYESLLAQENEVNDMINSDPSMKELAEDELKTIQVQKTAIEEQVIAIEKAEQEEE